MGLSKFADDSRLRTVPDVVECRRVIQKALDKLETGC